MCSLNIFVVFSIINVMFFYGKKITKTKISREHIQRAILDTCDLWDIWSEWWGDITWPTKRQWQRQIQKNTNAMTNIFREHIQRATCDLWDIWSEWLWYMTWPTKRQLLKQWQIQIQRPWQRHDKVSKIVYISDSWEPDFRTIILTWQLRVTLDSIRNSCDVLNTRKD